MRDQPFTTSDRAPKLPRRPVIRWPGRRPRSAPIPLARDPFICVGLTRLPPGADGRERFWTSSANAAFGSLGVCVDEYGAARLYPVGSYRHPSFFSAVATGPDTVWLCGNLATMLRLDLSSGRYETFPTGAPSASVFCGMAYDAATGKLLVAAFPPPRTVAVSFDTRAGRTARIHELATPDHYLRCHHAHPDGTYSLELQCPGLTFARWDPRTETVRLNRLPVAVDPHGNGFLLYSLIAGDDGRLYLPGVGWYDPDRGVIGSGPRPADDSFTWFERDATHAYGNRPGTTLFRRWCLATNEVTDLGDFPSTGLGFAGTTLTRSGRLVGVSVAGLFSRIEARTGALELSRRLPTDGVQPVDCVIRIDRERVLGTPFITQRFWETNLRTKRGFDGGPAAPGVGEVLRVWRLGGRIYLAAYIGGELMEYDPARPPGFPENPRVVAKPPTGMRPIASADDGRHIFYACSHHYGHLGSVYVRYDTRTGAAFYRDDPLPDQQMISFCYDRASRSLLCGTTYEADAASVPPRTQTTVLARLDAATGDVRQQTPGPTGAVGVRLIGPLGRGRWLGACWGRFADGAGSRWFVFDARSFASPAPADLRALPEWHTSLWDARVQYAGTLGLFVVKAGPRLELWDFRGPRRLRLLADSPHLGRFFVQGRDVLAWSAWDVFVLERVLPASS